MKKMFIILTALSLGAMAMAQTNASDESKKNDKGLFANMDPAARIQLMKKFDKDGDGRLDKEERQAAIEALKEKSADLEQLKKNQAKDVIKKFDKDGDGKLDQEELAVFLEEQRKLFEKQREHIRPRRNFKPSKEMLEKYDKDGDGKLDKNEREQMFKDGKAKRDALLKKYDADGDGKLNDSERDKLIQDPEVQGMMKNMMRNMISIPPPPPPPANN